MLPKYAQVKEEICSWLNQGKIQPDEKLPTENELMQQFGVSRHTIRKAIGDLVSQGLLYSVQAEAPLSLHARRNQPCIQTKRSVSLQRTYQTIFSRASSGELNLI